jgi:hypothetical protein
MIGNVRITYDPDVDPAYINLTDEQLPPRRDSIPVDLPAGMRPTSCPIGRTARWSARSSGRGIAPALRPAGSGHPPGPGVRRVFSDLPRGCGPTIAVMGALT